MATPLTTTLLGPMRELLVSGARRDQLLARGPGDPTPADEQARLRRLQESNALVVDDRRRRPLYFDGRFLAARDLTREQAYFLTRQADIGRAGGSGVVHGLQVRLPDDAAGADGRALRIEPGHGVTPAGESVVLPQALTLQLANVPDTEMLDAKFGIRRRPNESARNRTGLFIVALRPVEFTANPIAAYPTSLTDRRTVEDGDVIEGVVATLIPYPDPGGDGELPRRRARAARTLFVEGGVRGLPVDALPLAMVALERNTVSWLDPFMVRREVGAEHGDVLGLGLAPRAVREAYVLQYEDHLASVLRERDAANRGRRFAASEHFLALPAGGRLPAQAINAADFTQNYFPPEVDVELSIIPEDEVPALLEESLLLPPIDLTLSGEALESTAVLVLLPVAPHRVRTLRATLERLTRTVPTAAPGLIAQRRPLEVLRSIRLPRLPVPVLQPQAVADAAWAAELGAAASSGDGLLWYVRRRNVDYRSDVTGAAVRVVGNDAAVEATVRSAPAFTGLATRVDALRAGATALGGAELVSLLGSRRIAESPLLARAVVGQLERVNTAPGGTPQNPDPAPGTSTGGIADTPVVPPGALDRATVLKVAETFADPTVGDGLKRLETASPTLTSTPAVADGLVATGRVIEVDRVARTLGEAQLTTFATEIAAAAATGETARVDAVIAKTVAAAPIVAIPTTRVATTTTGLTSGVTAGRVIK